MGEAEEGITASHPKMCSPQAFFGLSLEKKTKSRIESQQGPVSTDYQGT